MQDIENLSQQAQIADQHRQEAKTAFAALFSGLPTPISQQIQSCHLMLDMTGVSSFYTPVPWQITLSDSSTIQGSGEMLSSALRDIHAHLRLCEEKFGGSDLVSLAIDATKL